MRKQGQVLNEQVARDFEVSIWEAVRRLKALGITLGSNLLANSLPDNYAEDDTAS